MINDQAASPVGCTASVVSLDWFVDRDRTRMFAVEWPHIRVRCGVSEPVAAGNDRACESRRLLFRSRRM